MKVTLSILLASKDHPHRCQLCLSDVGGYPSIGIPTGEKDDRGYTGKRACVFVYLGACVLLSAPSVAHVKSRPVAIICCCVQTIRITMIACWL